MAQTDSNHRVLVTGADGFLGSNIVRELLNCGYSVCGFIQNGRKADTLGGLPVELFHGDLLNTEDVVPLIKDCDYIIHTAGLTYLWPSKSSAIWKVNYTAVEHLVRLSKEHGIKRFIHIGTANSFGYGPKENPGSENEPYSGKWFGFDYFNSKQKAQEYIVSEARENSFPAIVINPTFMFGPYDSGAGSNRMILEFCRNRVPGHPSGGRNYVHVKDVAIAAVNAIQHGRIGQCYIIGNRNLSFKEVFTTMGETLDLPVPGFHIPKILAYAFGAFNGFFSLITGGQPKFSYKMARLACVDCYYKQDKAVEELSLELTPLEDAIMESYLWFKEKGQIS